ncbi:hypothetical protein MHOCP_06890 [Moorella humiferrea]|uniref:glycosyltransferase family 2 protein n=1 Tax=Neomoorella humiferrea TaxID=676965 RepID=UPI0030CC1766
MKISLVLATVNRTTELKRFLASLQSQSYRNYELIVVDQNPDTRLEPILTVYSDSFPIIHVRSEKGLSRARNIGLRYVRGDIVAFPDDDCWYSPDILERVVSFFKENKKWDGLVGRSVDANGQTTAGRFDLRSGSINKYNVWKRGISFSIFLRYKVVDTAGVFDEDLGAGAGTSWGSGEETDYLIRALKAGFKLFYDPSLTVGHANPVADYTVETINRALNYGAGMGWVLRKHGYPLWFVLYMWMRPLLGTLLAVGTGRLNKARYYWAVLRGRIIGWVARG